MDDCAAKIEIEIEIVDAGILVDNSVAGVVAVAVAGDGVKMGHGTAIPQLGSAKIRLEARTVTSVVFQAVWLSPGLAWNHAAIAVSVGVSVILEARAWTSLPERAQLLACRGM